MHHQIISFQDWLGIANFIVLFITALIVWEYTKAAQRSNEIQEEPLIHFIFKNTSPPGGSLNGTISVKNIGKGPAYGLIIEKFYINEYCYKFYLEDTLLDPQETKPLSVFVRKEPNITESSGIETFLNRLFPQGFVTNYSIESAIFLAHFKDVNNKIHHTVFALYSNVIWGQEIVMQYVERGEGRLTLEQARTDWEASEKIPSSVEV